MSPFHREFQNLVVFVFGIKIPNYIKIHHAANSERIAVCNTKKNSFYNFQMSWQCVKSSQTPHVLVLTWLQTPDFFSLHSLHRSVAKFLQTLGIPDEHQGFQTTLSGLYTWLSVGPRHRSWKSKDMEILVAQQVPPDCQRVRRVEESKLLWLVTLIEISLLFLFHAFHFKIVFLIILFTCTKGSI